MTLVDAEGIEYVGKPVGYNGRPTLREGIPLKLTWEFGTPNPFSAKLLPPPSAKIKQFSGIIIEPVAGGGFGKTTIDFHNVPAVLPQRKTK